MRDIVVIGGSAGSIGALRTIVRDLPADFSAAILIVVHISADFPSSLDNLLSGWGRLPASQAIDGSLVSKGRIYVAAPDHHLTIENQRIRVMRGPRENRHRPAIDPLFRSAAREYGSRVVGVILSGLQDDGSAGLYAVKKRGGLAMVQDPKDADWGEMPSHAIEYANPELILRTEDISSHLINVVNSDRDETRMTNKRSKKTGSKGSGVGLSKRPDENLKTSYNDEGEGVPSVFACPECHGVLWELKDKKIVRFRCRVGHSYGPDSLSKELSVASEDALWAAMRALEEKAAMQRRVADAMKFGNRGSADRLRDQSAADDKNARLIRAMIFQRDEKLEREKKPPAKSAA